MSERITNADLEAVCRRINRQVNGTDETPAWSQTLEGAKASIGVFYIDGAYGGVTLYRMANENGGVSEVFGSGHVPKRDLYDRMQAFLRGLEIGLIREVQS